MSGVASTGNAAGQARESNYNIGTDEIGDDYGSGYGKWRGGVLAADGCIYCAPEYHDQILKINPETSTTALVGKTLGVDYKYSGAASSKNGKFIYFVPWVKQRVLKFDVDSQNWVKIGDRFGDEMWSQPVLAHDNCIYATSVDPNNGITILKIGPSDDSIDLITVDVGGLVTGVFDTSVLSRDKKEIFFIPSYSTRILRFNIETKKGQFVGDNYEEYNKWMGGVLHDDGFVYAMPSNHTKILKYNPSDNTTELVGGDFKGNDESYKFSGCFKGSDGCIYGIPSTAHYILRFDPGTKKCSLVGKRYNKYEQKWQGCVQTTDGNIFAIPYSHNRVLKISLLGTNESAATRGINDTIDTPDLLGYDLYAQALANHVKSLCNSAEPEPLCVGLLAPWGTGKTFFWKLIRKEFEGKQAEDEQQTLREKIGSPPRKPFMIVKWFVKATILCAQSVQDFATKNQTARNNFLGKFLHFILLPVWWILLPSILLPLWLILAIILATVYILYYVLKLIPTIICLGRKTIDVEARGYTKSAMHQNNSDSSSNPRDLEKGEVIFVEFDAWTYRGTDDVWASLLAEIWTAVEEGTSEDDVKWHRAGSKKKDEEPEKYRSGEEAEEDMKRRYDIWESIAHLAIVALVVAIIVLGIFALPTAAPTPIPTPSPISTLVDSPTASPTASPTPAPSYENIALKWLLGILLPLVPASIGSIKASRVKKYAKSGFEVIDEQMKKHDSKTFLDKFARKDFSQHKGFMGEVQKEVKFLISYLKDRNVRLVAFVDDLDRCDQDTTMQILWAVKLLLSEGPISCWLAIDTKIVVDYIEADFTTPISGYQYLEKIINLPFTIPAMDKSNKVPFIEGVMDAPELNAHQVYDKLCSLKHSSGYEILQEMNEGVVGTDEKSRELIKLAMKINALHPRLFSADSLKMIGLGKDADPFGEDVASLLPKLKENNKANQSFYSKLLRVARTNLVTTYNNFYNLLENENWIGYALQDSDKKPLDLPSPRVDKYFKTLRSKDELASDLLTFLRKVQDVYKSQDGVEVDLGLKGFEFAEMASIVFEQMAEDARGVQEDAGRGLQEDADRIKQFRKKFCRIPEESTAEASGAGSDTGSNHHSEDEIGTNNNGLDDGANNNNGTQHGESNKVDIEIGLANHHDASGAISDTGSNRHSEEQTGTNTNGLGEGADHNNGTQNGESKEVDIEIGLPNQHDASAGSSENDDGSSPAPIDVSEGNNVNNGENEEEINQKGSPVTKFYYKNLSMVDEEEREFIMEYAGFLSDVPRKIKRVMNVYAVTKKIAFQSLDRKIFPKWDLLKEKIFILTVLQESFPYRMSWLVLMADEVCATSEEYSETNSGKETFHSLLKELAEEKGNSKIVDELPLFQVYDRIICGMLHCLPNSENLLRADTHTQHFSTLLRGLKLKDLICDQSKGGLQKLLFNMPQGMLNDVRNYNDHCASVKKETKYKYWTAMPEFHPKHSNSTLFLAGIKDIDQKIMRDEKMSNGN